MFRWRCSLGVGASVRSHGAPVRTRRPQVSAPLRSERKSSKERFDLHEALRRDRERIEANRSAPWRERWNQLKVYPWKTFIVFMTVWSYAGMYAVPYFKGVRSDGSPSLLPNGKVMPEDIRERMMPPEIFRKVTPKKAAEIPATNRDAPRY